MIGESVSEEDINGWFDKIDKDKSGSINYEEFQKFMEEWMKKSMQST